MLAHPEAKKYVAGIAVHWYADLLTSPNVLSRFHDKFPNHFILATEACEGKSEIVTRKLLLVRVAVHEIIYITYFPTSTTGDKPWQESVSLGSWERLESYAHDIIEVNFL